MDRTTLPQQIRDLTLQTSLMRNEICCKLRELIGATGGGQHAYITKLTSGGTASFTTSVAPPAGSVYVSVTMRVISLTTGTVTVTDATGATAVSYAGFTATWNSSSTALTIAVTGDAIVVVNYTTI